MIKLVESPTVEVVDYAAIYAKGPALKYGVRNTADVT